MFRKGSNGGNGGRGGRGGSSQQGSSSSGSNTKSKRSRGGAFIGTKSTTTEYDDDDHHDDNNNNNDDLNGNDSSNDNGGLSSWDELAVSPTSRGATRLLVEPSPSSSSSPSPLVILEEQEDHHHDESEHKQDPFHPAILAAASAASAAKAAAICDGGITTTTTTAHATQQPPLPTTTTTSPPPRPHEPATMIYSAPTVDTLSDGSSLVRFYNDDHDQRPPPASSSRRRSHLQYLQQTHEEEAASSSSLSSAQQQQQQQVMLQSVLSSTSTVTNDDSDNTAASNIRRRTTTTMTGSTEHHPLRGPAGAGGEGATTTAGVAPAAAAARLPFLNQPPPQRWGNSRSSKQQQHQQPKDFQLEEDAMTVTVRTIPVAQRSAFNAKLPRFLDDDDNDDDDTTTHNNIDNGDSDNDAVQMLLRSNPKKVSPSLQHWQILQRLNNVSHIRQLAFSPSCGTGSDIFWNEVTEEEQETVKTKAGAAPTTTTTVSSSKNNSTDDGGRFHSPSSNTPTTTTIKRDGRYRSIDPVQATIAALPAAPPLLSNKKHRLPMRTDVGFANPTEDEIQQKQLEIQKESEWEEASPRLIVLVTSDDLGKAVVPKEDEDIDHDDDNGVNAVNGGGLPGMPWAGKDLVQAKERNQRHFALKGRRQQHQHLRPSQRATTSMMMESVESGVPQRTGMLAPPLDATYSATLGWRPRPFHDRPPGLRYALVCPLAVDFDIGNKVEPLVCSLSLYWLPEKGAGAKVSEEFYFPAGDWHGKLELGSLRTQSTAAMNVDDDESNVDGNEDQRTALILKLWEQRKQKALFSYDPLMLGGDGSERDLYVVFQVYKVAHVDAVAAYLADEGNGDSSPRGVSETSSTTKKTWKKRLKKHFSSKNIGQQPHTETRADEFDVQRTHVRANAVFATYGTQFTTPLCFGVTNLFTDGSTATSRGNEWPRGQVQQGIKLCMSPSHSESHDDFVQRLQNIVPTFTSFEADQTSILSFPPESGAMGRRDEISLGTSTNPIDTTEISTPSKKKGSVRKFLSPGLGSKREVVPRIPSNQPSLDSAETAVVSGSVTLFSSYLDVDFLQAMLLTPPELIDKVSIQYRRSRNDVDGSPQNEELVIPRVLVDSSGGSAISIEPKNAIFTSGSNATIVAKRSDLVRLPSSKEAEFLDLSEFREVLFMPPRLRKGRDADFSQADHRSLLNLLYLYPRSLTLKTDQVRNQKRPSYYTIRTQLVQNRSTTNDSGVVVSSNHVLARFHNPSAWGGSTMLRFVHTRIPSGKDHDADSVRSGIPFRDEHKLSLPTVLDGTHFLQFSLFGVEIEDEIDEPMLNANSPDASPSSTSREDECGIKLELLAETTIPLSSSSTRDHKSGAKAATIIPNGTHRVRLGDYQLQVETRLVSYIHVSDPAVAAALRDFPIANDTVLGLKTTAMPKERIEELALVTSSRNSVTSRQLSFQVEASSKEKVSYTSLFTTATGSAIVGHFQPLLLLHLSNLIQSSVSGGGSEINESFLRDNIQSLLVLVMRVKQSFQSSTRPTSENLSENRFQVFFKSTVDSFDELLFQSTQGQPIEDDAASEGELETANDDDFNFTEHDNFDGGAIRRRKKQSMGNPDRDLRISRTLSAMESTEVPFSRVAYGATKSDRMRLEAELEVDDDRFTHLFDDDETVVTIATTRQAEAQMKEARTAFEKTKIQSAVGEGDGAVQAVVSPNSVEAASDHRDGIHSLDFSAYQKSISELALGKRMKNAAQVMLAPCATTPAGLSAVLLCRTSTPPQTTSNLESTISQSGVFRTESFKESQRQTIETLSSVILSPASDLEDDGDASDSGDAILLSYHTTKGIFRAPHNCKTIHFTIPHNWVSRKNSIPVGRGRFLYESVMVLWLDAWLDHMKATGRNLPVSFVDEFLGTDAQSKSYALFHQQMELLLPLLLKSIALRYSQTKHLLQRKTARVILDDGHKRVFESFVEMLAVGLVGDAMAEVEPRSKPGRLQAALHSCDLVVDFLVGLFPLFHSAHMELLITRFIDTLRACETEHDKQELPFQWNKVSLHRVKASRQLRLRTVEKLAVLPNFVALNFPPHFVKELPASNPYTHTWLMQKKESCSDELTKEHPSGYQTILVEDDGMKPAAGWLASLLTSESLSICALSCEAVVAEAMAHIETQDSVNMKGPTPLKSSLKNRPTASLQRSDLLMFQSIAIHAITCVHELLLRRHAMDKRFQKESSRERIAALFAQPIFDKSVGSVRWLARMESTHKVRSIWLLCFVYVLQEAPEILIRKAIRSYSTSPDFRIHRFIRLLRLGSSTFQSFIDQQRHCMFPFEIDKRISPWLLQESFNTICATTILVVEESADPISAVPDEQRKMMQGILDLLLHVLTTPQSTVTHLRAVGGAIQALEKFGANLFLEITGSHLQHWIRVILGLMNNTALSVRSIAVDFMISFFGGVFDLHGCIGDVSLQVGTLLPEVTAREIALFSVSGLVETFEDAEKAVWPLRRSFAELEDANPLDDDRVDPQLSSTLAHLCRSCQAIMDGVIIEMRLRGDSFEVAGTKLRQPKRGQHIFDADEESLFEAASFFAPETAPIQKLRWLMTLKELHVGKEHWIEAADCLIMSAKTIIDSLRHLSNVWRPTRFSLWSDARRSLWLSTVGEEVGNPRQGNAQVMAFASSFLEPSWSPNLSQPTLAAFCKLLTSISRDAVSFYSNEGFVDGLAYSRLETTLRMVMSVLDEHHISGVAKQRRKRADIILQRKRFVEEEASLRRVIASITGDMTKLAEKLLLTVREQPDDPKIIEAPSKESSKNREQKHFFVRLLLSGKKPARFHESTSLPTFLEWGQPCICRVPKSIVDKSLASVPKNSDRLEVVMCTEFGNAFRDCLLQSIDESLIVFQAGMSESGPRTNGEVVSESTCMSICFVRPNLHGSESAYWDSPDFHGYDPRHRHFIHRKATQSENGERTVYVETTVAHAFPCPLSRQHSMATSEFVGSK